MDRVIAAGIGDASFGDLLGNDDMHPAFWRALAEKVAGAQDDRMQPSGLRPLGEHRLNGDTDAALDG